MRKNYSKFRINQKSFLNFSEIINKYKKCITTNPKGIDFNWPKSYSEYYYNVKLRKIFIVNKSPNILEINKPNKFKIFLWKKFFVKPVVEEIEFYKKEDLSNIKNKCNSKLLYIITINDYKKIKDIFSLINLLEKKLNSKGIIIIQDFHFNFYLTLKLFLNFNIHIYDFRLNRFIINNCILEINKSKHKKYDLNYIRNLLNLIKYLIIDSIFRMADLIITSKRK